MADVGAIEVLVDGRPRPVRPGSTLADLVAELGLAPQAMATAVNGAFVARGQRGDCVLKAGDAVLLFQPIVGG